MATTTDATGHFFLKNLKEGTYRLEASALGFVTVSKQVQVVRNRTVEVQFELLPDVIGLEQVVVTGNKNEAVRRKSSSLVQVMSSKLLTDVGAVCLADGLNFQPGVRVENDCQNCGFTQVRIGNLVGYMKAEYLTTNYVASAMPLLKINSSGKVNLREQASTSSNSLGLYPKDTEAILLGFNGNWAHVIVDGKIGFMLTTYLK